MHFYFKKNYSILRVWLLALLLVFPLLVNAGAFEQLFAPKAELWEVWQVHNEESPNNIEHKDWTLFLQNNIRQGRDGVNRLDYAAISSADRNSLRSYVEALQRINISEYRRSEQLAYWINLYNAVTVNVVVTHYPVESIRDIDISPGFFADGPWGKKIIRVNNEEISLNDIEHRILRPVWKDARIHFAVNCASVGCPDLNQQAFLSEMIDEQLDSAAKKYIAHPRGVKMTDDGVVVSSIFSWFQKDFGDTEADVIKYIQQYANDSKSKSLEGIRFFSGDEYDWSLNDASGLTH